MRLQGLANLEPIPYISRVDRGRHGLRGAEVANCTVGANSGLLLYMYDPDNQSEQVA
jgi:hypothetical protein